MAKKLKLPLVLPPPAGGRVDVLIVAGEHSGDEHAARMVRELRARRPGLAICALGGPALAGAGAQLLHDLTASSVVGLVEVLKHYPFFPPFSGPRSSGSSFTGRAPCAWSTIPASTCAWRGCSMRAG